MRHFRRLDIDIDTTAAVAQLAQHPELWNANPERVVAAGSPHSQTSDIWVRFRDRADITGPDDFLTPHFPVWYPAYRLLPALEPIIMVVQYLCRSVHLGGVLITRLPPGGVIAPHTDLGGWHSEFHNCKVHVPLLANPGCLNQCCDESVSMQPGQAWEFNNLTPHAVENRGDTDRITLIIPMRVE